MSIKESLKQYGLSSIPRFFKFILRRFGIVVETFYLLSYIIDKSTINEKYRTYDFSEVRELTNADTFLLNFIGKEKLKLFQERFNSENYSCFSIIKNDKVAYLTWISWRDMNYPTLFNKQEKLDGKQALLEDSYCDPDYRGKGLHSKMNIFRLKKIIERGRFEALVMVLKENKPAIKVQIKSGFSIKSKLCLYKIGEYTKIIVKKHR